MRLETMVAGFLFAGMAVVASGQTAATSSNVDVLLAPVSWLVGGTWTVDVKDGDDTTHVENRIRWAPNHTAIEFNTDFNGKPHYNGFYAYDPAKKSVVFYYTASNGELTLGATTQDPDGKTLHQDFDIMKPDGTTVHLRSTLVRDGNDAYFFNVFLQKNGDWAQAFHIRYERKP